MSTHVPGAPGGVVRDTGILPTGGSLSGPEGAGALPYLGPGAGISTQPQCDHR